MYCDTDGLNEKILQGGLEGVLGLMNDKDLAVRFVAGTTLRELVQIPICKKKEKENMNEKNKHK